MATHQQKTRYFLANGLAAVMDFGVGSLLSVTILLLCGQEVTFWAPLVGGMLALVPDFDSLPHILSFRFVNFDHHTSPFHRPLLVLPIFVGLAGMVLGGVWALIAAVCLVYHYAHDTGWTSGDVGIAWLWPFSEKCWSWWGSYEQPSHIPHQLWLDTYWLQPTKRSASELALGVTALSIALVLSSVPLGFWFIPVIFVMAAGVVWWAQ